MLDTLKYASLVAGVQRKMFCPGCKKVMDVKDAVEVTVENDGKIIGLSHSCAGCYDRQGGEDGIKAHLTKNGAVFTAIEVLDGREADWEMAEMMGMFS